MWKCGRMLAHRTEAKELQPQQQQRKIRRKKSIRTRFEKFITTRVNIFSLEAFIWWFVPCSSCGFFSPILSLSIIVRLVWAIESYQYFFLFSSTRFLDTKWNKTYTRITIKKISTQQDIRSRKKKIEWLVRYARRKTNENKGNTKPKKITPDEQPKLKRTTDRNDYSFIIVKILDFIVTRMSRNRETDNKRYETNVKRTNRSKWKMNKNLFHF